MTFSLWLHYKAMEATKSKLPKRSGRSVTFYQSSGSHQVFTELFESSFKIFYDVGHDDFRRTDSRRRQCFCRGSLFAVDSTKQLLTTCNEDLIGIYPLSNGRRNWPRRYQAMFAAMMSRRV